MSSLAPLLAAINSASVDSATDHCSWLEHATALSAYTATTPLVGPLVLISHVAHKVGISEHF